MKYSKGVNNNNNNNNKKKKKKKKKWPSVKKKTGTCHLGNFSVPVDKRGKIKETEKIEEYFDLSWEINTAEYRGDRSTNHKWCTCNVSEKFEKKITWVEK